jgi:hypothetical protein
MQSISFVNGYATIDHGALLKIILKRENKGFTILMSEFLGRQML